MLVTLSGIFIVFKLVQFLNGPGPHESPNLVTVLGMFTSVN